MENPFPAATCDGAPPGARTGPGAHSSPVAEIRLISPLTASAEPGRTEAGSNVPPRARWAADSRANSAGSSRPDVATSTVAPAADQARVTSSAGSPAEIG